MRLRATMSPAEGPLPGVSLMVTLLEAADTDHVMPGLDCAAASARWPSHATIRPTPTSAPAAASMGGRRADGGRPPRRANDGRGTPADDGRGTPGRVSHRRRHAGPGGRPALAGHASPPGASAPLRAVSGRTSQQTCAYPLTTPQNRTFCLLDRIRRAVMR